MDPVSASLMIGMAIAAAAAAAEAKKEQNNAIKKSMDAQNEAAKQTLKGQTQEGDAQSNRTNRDEARVRGLNAVSAAERGVGMGGSAALLDQTAAAEGATNRYNIQASTQNRGLATLSGLNATQQQLVSHSGSVLLAGLQGGISGASTGLSIGNGINEAEHDYAMQNSLSQGAPG